MSRTISRWVPAAVAVAVVATGAIAIPMAANAESAVAPKSASQLVAMIANSKVDAFSGTVKTVSNLGLPSLPSTSGGSSAGSTADISSVLSLLSASQTARVFVDGATKARVQIMSTLAEQDVIRNGSDVWQYDSKKNAVTHATLGTTTRKTPTTTHTPAEIAKALLAKLDPTTTTSVGQTSQVANRSTYTLVLTPKATDTLVRSVNISVDTATGLPLAVEVDARGQKDAAFGVEFDSINLSTPAASTFKFTPPKGAKVTEEKAPARTPKADASAAPTDRAKPTVTGTGWDAVVATPTATASASTGTLTESKVFTELTTAVTGGRLFHTALVNVLITDDGRVIAGSVPVARLQAVAAAQ
jgi:outer membrane lipoprotein-sorting protein